DTGPGWVRFTSAKHRKAGQNSVGVDTDGPRCLIKAPPASYNVIATYEGATKRATVQTGSMHHVQLRW
ncbi:hypothetical protein M0F05_17905, partial [Ralstonia solanacearum]|nr:hypothetical protein [Ralstonia solanacearum]